MIVGMLSFLAVVFDFSRMYAQKNELQTAADAASLAGVLELLSDTTLVADSAISIGQRNEVLKKTIALFPADVDCGTWDDPTAVYTRLHSGTTCASSDNAVRVATRDSANFVFPVLVGASGKELNTSAIAWAAYIGAAACVKPVAMRYELLTKILDPTNPDLLRVLTAYDLQQLATLPRDALRFMLKTGHPAVPGNFGALSLPGGQGGNWFRANLGGCYAGFIGRDTVVNTQTGNLHGPVLQGARVFCQWNINPSAPECQDSNGNMGRLMVVPLWHTADAVAGNTSVTIKGLVSFNVDSVTPQAEIIGHFVAALVAGTVSSTPSTLRRIVLVK